MSIPKTNTGASGPYWGEKEQTVSAPIPLLTRTEVSRIPGIPTSVGNLVSHVKDDGNRNMLYVLTNWKPWFGLGSNSRGPVPEILVG